MRELLQLSQTDTWKRAGVQRRVTASRVQVAKYGTQNLEFLEGATYKGSVYEFLEA